MEFRYPALSDLDVFVRIWPGDGNLLGVDARIEGVPVILNAAGTVFRGRIGLGKEVRRLLDIAANVQRVNPHGDFATVELELFQQLPVEMTPLPGLPASSEFNNKRFPFLREKFNDGQNEIRIAQALRII